MDHQKRFKVGDVVYFNVDGGGKPRQYRVIHVRPGRHGDMDGAAYAIEQLGEWNWLITDVKPSDLHATPASLWHALLAKADCQLGELPRKKEHWVAQKERAEAALSALKGGAP
jgi:hypothetical protein